MANLQPYFFSGTGVVGHHFSGGCPGLLITLFLPCPTLYIHSNHYFFQCPAPFYHTHFSSDPGAGMGAEQFDRRITDLAIT